MLDRCEMPVSKQRKERERREKSRDNNFGSDKKNIYVFLKMRGIKTKKPTKSASGGQ